MRGCIVYSSGVSSHISFHKAYLLEILKDLDGPVLLEAGAPSGSGRFTHSSSPNILVMSMQKTGQQPDPEPEQDPDAGDGDDSGEETPEE